MPRTKKDMRIRDAFWYDKPEVLFAQSRLLEFVPVRDMSSAEQMNALVRFSIYLALLLLILGTSHHIVFLPVVVAGATIIFNRHGIDAYARTQQVIKHVLGEDNDNTDDTGDDIEEFGNAGEEHRVGKRGVGARAEMSPIGSNAVPQVYLDKKVDPAACQQPTKENPFMNVLVTDYRSNPNRPAACTRKQHANIKDMINTNFEHGLFQNVDEAWGKNHSRRQFHPMPWTTIPNDQSNFSKWLYHQEPTLKEQGLIQHPKRQERANIIIQ